MGTNNSTTKVDFPDFALALAKEIRTALFWSPDTIVNSRTHNNTNVLILKAL